MPSVAEVMTTVASAFVDQGLAKRAVVRAQLVGDIDPATQEAVVTTADQECLVILDVNSRSRHNDTSIDRRDRPWLVQGLTAPPAAGNLLVVEGEGTAATFSHGGVTRTGAALPIVGEPIDLSAGARALWEVLA